MANINFEEITERLNIDIYLDLKKDILRGTIARAQRESVASKW